MASCPKAWFCVPHTEGRLAQQQLTLSACPHAPDGSPMTVRGGGVPYLLTHGFNAVRMGPPPRSFRCDAHHCIMVRVAAPTAYKDVARMFVHPHAGLPSDVRYPDQSNCAVVLGTVKDEPSVGADAPILDRSCARQPTRKLGRGEETGLPCRTKKLGIRKWIGPLGHPLDRNFPIQVCVASRPRFHGRNLGEVRTTGARGVHTAVLDPTLLTLCRMFQRCPLRGRGTYLRV